MRHAAPLAAVLAAVFVTACAVNAPVQNYRPAGSDADAWQIEGTLDVLDVAIRINGAEVMTGKLSLLGGAAELSGEYEGEPVSASCTTIAKFMQQVRQCMVFVRNERAATLQF